MADHFTLTLLILIIALLLGKWLPIPLAYHPLSFFAAFCDALANKVHPDPQRPATQQRVSGLLAVILVLSIPLILLACLYLFASWAPIIDATVLLFCANWQPYLQQVEKINQSLNKELMGLARVQARLLLLRDTENLSRMGLIKALLESVSLRFSQHVIATIFWYLLTGPIGLLCYRLCQIASQRWSVKLPKNRHFGAAACYLHQVFCFIPYCLSLGLLYLQSQRKSSSIVSTTDDTPMPRSKLWLLRQLSKTLQVNLAGPVFYQRQKVKRLRLQQQHDPDLADLTRLLRLQQHQFALLLLLLTGLLALEIL